MNDMKIQNFDEMFSQFGLHPYREGGDGEGKVKTGPLPPLGVLGRRCNR